MESKQKPLIPI